MEKEVQAKTGSATRVIGGMNEIVLSRNTKLKVLNAEMMLTLNVWVRKETYKNTALHLHGIAMLPLLYIST